MASVVKRVRKRGGASWYARYRDGNGRDVWERCASARDARARAAEVETLLNQSSGTWAQPEKKTVARYSEEWLAARRSALRERTHASYTRLFEREILPNVGHLPLTALTRQHIRDYANQRANAGAAANTIRNALAPLRAMLTTALEDGLVRENVAYRLPRVGKPKRTISPPTREQVEAVIAVCDTDAAGPIRLAAASGLRRGEVFALRWGDVDFERLLIHVRGSNHNGTITPTKTEAGERLVPMFGSLRRLLLELKAASPHKQPDDFVFPAVTGEARNPAGWMRWDFYPALKKATVAPFRFHDLRHFAVSQLIAQGANILQISRIAGHADPSITLKVYSHLFPDGLAEAADRYDPLRIGAEQSARWAPAAECLPAGPRGLPLTVAPPAGARDLRISAPHAEAPGQPAGPSDHPPRRDATARDSLRRVSPWDGMIRIRDGR